MDIENAAKAVTNALLTKAVLATSKTKKELEQIVLDVLRDYNEPSTYEVRS